MEDAKPFPKMGWITISISLLAFVACLVTVEETVHCQPKVGMVAKEQGRMKSLEESFGFFQYSDEMWLAKKHVFERQSARQHSPNTYPSGRTYFQYNWEPDFTCDHEERIGNIGDGGKWLCQAYLLARAEECNVMSIGSANDYSFEDAVHALNPRCSIHTFDHTVAPTGTPPYVHFHSIGLGTHNQGNIHTMKDVIGIIGMEGKPIDILKIDCEGCEFEVYPEFFQIFIRQILMEIHFTTHEQTNSLLQAMHDHGYAIFHKEPNTSGCSGDCIEYAFVKLNLSSV